MNTTCIYTVTLHSAMALMPLPTRRCNFTYEHAVAGAKPRIQALMEVESKQVAAGRRQRIALVMTQRWMRIPPAARRECSSSRVPGAT